MRYFLLTAVISAYPICAQNAADQGVIDGRVLDSVTGEAIPRAVVELGGGESATLAMQTDATGRFHFSGLPQGRYTLTASRAGYLEPPPGKRPVARPVALAHDAHVSDINLHLMPQGVIAGRILNEDGDPAGHLEVTVLQRIYRDGKKQWNPVGEVVSNEIGEYRIANLSPGAYLLEVTGRSFMGLAHPAYVPGKPGMFYAPVYYPSAPTQAAAAPIDLAAGVELRGIDFHIISTPSYRIRGKLTSGPAVGGVDVTLYPRFGGLLPIAGAKTEPDGRFELSNIPPGEYIASAGMFVDRLAWTASQPVMVSGNVDGLVLALVSPLDVPIQIRVAEADAHVNLRGLEVKLNRTLMDFMSGEPQGKTDDEGKTLLRGIPAGRYGVALDMPDGCFELMVKLDGKEIEGDEFDLPAGGPLEIVLSATAGQITGLVTDKDGNPIGNAAVALVPSANGSRTVSTFSGGNGDFTFSVLRPDTYKLFVWEGVEDGAWEDGEFRKKYEDRATEIKLRPSETQKVQVRIITAEEIK